VLGQVREAVALNLGHAVALPAPSGGDGTPTRLAVPDPPEGEVGAIEVTVADNSLVPALWSLA
jgi:hypothetical protein